MMMNRFISGIKSKSRETLRAWTYQCESIIAQRSHRLQKLAVFYETFYGRQGLKQLIHAYYRQQVQVPLKRFAFAFAAGFVGIQAKNNEMDSSKFDWSKERLSLANFKSCWIDVEFINGLPKNELCARCKALNMKYCFCSLGNKKCKSQESSKLTIPNCRRPLHLDDFGLPEGKKVIETAEENDWEPYVSKNNISIWRREEKSSMYSYKLYANFDDITADDFMQVQIDLNYRKIWDDSAVKLELIGEDATPKSNSHLIYWEMQWPTLFSNRDYVYCRRYIKSDWNKLMIVCSSAADHPDYPEFPGKVRVTNYWSAMVIKPYTNFNEPGVHFVLTYFDDPGVPIPQNIKSWVAQKQMPDFVQKLYDATKKYAQARTLDMKELFNHLVNKHEYSANVCRSTWLDSLLKLRERSLYSENDKR